MNVKQFTTEVFENELRKLGLKLNSEEIEILQNTFDFGAIQFKINQDLEPKGRINSNKRYKKLSYHKRLLKILARKYAYIIYTKHFIRNEIITESTASDSQAQLKCNNDIYPCEKKGFSSAY